MISVDILDDQYRKLPDLPSEPTRWVQANGLLLHAVAVYIVLPVPPCVLPFDLGLVGRSSRSVPFAKTWFLWAAGLGGRLT